MADRIVINTDILTQTARRLSTLQNELQQTAGMLDHVQLNRSNGGTLDWGAGISLRCSGMQLRGGTIEGMVRAYARGLRATGSYTRELGRAVQQAAAQMENTERSLLGMLGALKTGEESRLDEGGATVLNAYIAPDKSANMYYTENKEALRQQNEFWDTEYNERILKQLREKIMTDKNYDEHDWEQLSPAEKEERVRRYVREIGEIFGTEADVVFGRSAKYRDANGQIHDLELGVDSPACYHRDSDCIQIDMDDKYSYDLSIILANVAHEMRHAMQYDIKNATESELKQKYDLDGSDLNSIRQAQTDWRSNFDNYVSPSNEQLVRQRTEEIKRQRSLSQWWFLSDDYISPKEAKSYARNELGREYYRQQIEVDAMQIGDEVRKVYQEKQIAHIEEESARLELEEQMKKRIYGPWLNGY